jgi:hypothetical protein
MNFQDDSLGTVYDVGDITGWIIRCIAIRGIMGIIIYFFKQNSTSYINIKTSYTIHSHRFINQTMQLCMI